MAYIFIALIIVLLLIVLCLILSARSQGKLFRNKTENAKKDFEKISMPWIFCTEEIFAEYIHQYEPLVQEINKYRSKFLTTKRDFSRYELDKFISFFEKAHEIKDKNNKICHSIEETKKWLDVFKDKTDSLFVSGHYLTYSEKENFLETQRDEIEKFRRIYSEYREYLSGYSSISIQILDNLEERRKKHNAAVVQLTLDENRQYFDSILDYPLDVQQREAIAVMEDNTLVISSAGSGKTSTIIGKAHFLLEKFNINPKRLLILTYTRKAAEELKERLGNNEVDCSTFHSLAVRIIAKLENRKPSICEPSLLLNVFLYLLQTNKDFKQAILHYILHLRSRMKLEHEYEKAPEYFADRKKYGIQAPYSDARGKIIFTKSEEEKRICTYLAELGVEFLYEEPYEIKTYTEDHRQYKPDFTIFVSENTIDPLTGFQKLVTRKVYLEHFAVNAEGKVPKWFGDKDPIGGWYAENKKYNDGIKWKRKIHNENNTVLLETRSADFHSGKILEVLKEQLRNAKVPIRNISTEDLYDRIVKRSKRLESSVFKLLEQFVALYKSNCPQDLNLMIAKARDLQDKRTYIILKDIMGPLMNEYEKVLRHRGEIDFTDAILSATRLCDEGYWLKYDYILVDEFQDISIDRFKFLQSLRHKNPLTKLFCVGDDWQSIYRFAGSNMRLFFKFKEYFGHTVNCKIEKTYRLSDPLLSISSAFIQRNPEQLTKEIIASDSAKKIPTSIDFHDCGKSDVDGSMLKETINIIQNIPSNENILILGRYNYDVRYLGYNTELHDFDRNQERIELNIAGRRIRFMSVHSAKGLEADNIILINCNAGINGFPSLIEDDPVLATVLSDEDQFENAEERRLFYVALTRARKHLHILYNSDKPSPFVREIINVNHPEDYLCPVCKEGKVVKQKEGVASNGKKYINYGCSNANVGCDYFERVFGNDKPLFILFNDKEKV